MVHTPLFAFVSRNGIRPVGFFRAIFRIRRIQDSTWLAPLCYDGYDVSLKVCSATNELSRFLQACKELVSKNPEECTVIFIPTAADLYEDKNFVEEDRKELIELGYSVEDFDIKEKDERQLLERFEAADIIFIAGGNSFYLLEKIKESGFDKIIKKLLVKGVVYVGSSAGAIIVGPSIEPIKLLDDPGKAPNLESFDGLNLIDFVPLPHFDNNKYGPKCKKAMGEYKGRFKFLPIKDRQAAIVENGEIRFVEMK